MEYVALPLFVSTHQIPRTGDAVQAGLIRSRSRAPGQLPRGKSRSSCGRDPLHAPWSRHPPNAGACGAPRGNLGSDGRTRFVRLAAKQMLAASGR